MFKLIDGLPEGIEGFSAVGEVRAEDYQDVLRPVLEAARKDGRRVRLLFEFGPEFDGYSAGGVWEDLRMGLQYLRLFGACAVLTDRDWIAKGARVVAPMLPFPVRQFGLAHRQEALEWLETWPAPHHTKHRLLPDAGVLVLEVEGKVRAEDFDAITVTVDTWLEANNTLSGIVIHSPRLEGWANVGAFLRHVRFVREHHEKVGRVGVVAGGAIAQNLPAVVNPFVNAEVRAFEPHQLQKAIEWASGG